MVSLEENKLISGAVEPNAERNAMIVILSRHGVATREIAMRFNITPGRVLQIVKRNKAREDYEGWKSRFLEVILEADELDRKWPATELIDAFMPKGAHRIVLSKHFKGKGKEDISLRDLMDLVISEEEADRMEWPTPPIYVRGMGKCGMRRLMHGLSDSDLGKRCNTEWTRRLALLKKDWPEFFASVSKPD